MDTKAFPTTLQGAVKYFADYENCHAFMMDLRWPDGKVKCPHCGSERVTYLEKARVFKCYEKHPLAKFSLKVGTIFEDSPVSLDKWLLAVWLVVNCKNGVSSYEVGRALGVTQKTAWFMDHRIRFALHAGSFDAAMGGEGSSIVEADETFIGGLARNMHKGRKEKMKGRTHFGKTIVMGLLERDKKGSKVRTRVISDRTKAEMLGFIAENVTPKTTVYTDEHASYFGLAENFQHDFVNHAETYVKGSVHTNGIENFWSLLKRGIRGTYVSVEPFHMFRYLDEQSFRFNERFGNDKDRFLAAMQGIVDRRLTWNGLTGKVESASPEANAD